MKYEVESIVIDSHFLFLLATLGGNFGLFLGMSILTILEFVDLAFRRFCFFLCRTLHGSNQRCPEMNILRMHSKQWPPKTPVCFLYIFRSDNLKRELTTVRQTIYGQERRIWLCFACHKVDIQVTARAGVHRYSRTPFSSPEPSVLLVFQSSELWGRDWQDTVLQLRR